VAVINSYQGQVFDWCASGSTDTYNSSVMGLFNALYAANLNADIVCMETLTMEKLRCYRAVMLPFPYYIQSRAAQLLRDWVGEGGLLISEAFPATVCGDTGLHETTVPGLGLDCVFGVREGAVFSGSMFQGGYAGIALSAQTEPVPITMEGCARACDGVPGYLFQQELVPLGATVLGRFANGAPAVTSNGCGAGTAVLAGTLLGCAYQKDAPYARNISRLLLRLVEGHGIDVPVHVDKEGVRVDLLTGPDGGALLVINGGNPGACVVNITLCAHIGDKTEAIDIITDGRTPLVKCGECYKLSLEIGPNHHEVYVLA
jgi:hypothetical protein